MNFSWYDLLMKACLSSKVEKKGKSLKRMRKRMMPKEKVSLFGENFLMRLKVSGGQYGIVWLGLYSK